MITRKENEYDDFEILTDFENLYEAHKSCRKGKRWKDSVATYDLRDLECTLYLQYLLKSGKYKISEYHCFKVNERGKERDIKSTQYKDRIVQKCLHEKIIIPRIAPTFIYDNGASLKGKGTDFQLDRLKEHLRQYVAKNGTDGYILVGDFSGYFDSIAHDLVNSFYAKEFSDERILQLIYAIHATIPGGVGVPPMHLCAQTMPQADAVLAFRSADRALLTEEMVALCGEVEIMTDDGSLGKQGFAAQGVAEMLAKKPYVAVFACGPKIMLKTTYEAAAAAGVPCWVSLEERMGCGLGACLTCATPIRDETGRKVMKEACKDGPVFRGEEVIWDG